ncbi:PAS domain-containing hybrid sensor histidine kinase/response regulator [Roseateles toxinivorans]|uniref:histidine kinase n=1 Tax=Roseateles toxinivorans TaxID=270368 RepID=A0A4R6QSI3_9BURK|nr:PAS domain S-box protein [Roseateles toxinivorans]TDP74494.1 PAS domain S-box-containing protein [Roseateles toxinivorans]
MANTDHYRRLEMIVQNTTNMVVVTNRNREIEWVNPAYTQVTGWTLDEIKGRNPRTFLHGPRTSQASATKLGDLLRQGQAVVDVEMLNYKKSGDPFWVSMNISPIRDDRGAITEYVAIESDITERKRRDIETGRIARHSAAMQRIAKLGYMEHDLATGQVYCSTEVLDIIEATSDDVDLRYESLMAWTHPDDVAMVRLNYEQAVNDAGPYESEHRVISKSGQIKWVHMQGAIEGWDDGSTARCCMTVQEVTQRRLKEQEEREEALQRQLATIQSDMLSRISQEFRTPLQAMLGFTELVERREVPLMSDRSRGQLKQVRQSARQLLHLVHDMMEFNRLHEARSPLIATAVDVHGMVRDLASSLRSVAQAQSLTLHADIGNSTLYARADYQGLRQILLNLLANAFDYNIPGGHVWLQCKSISGSRVAISVQDSGIGFERKHLSHLFEPFYRVARSPADLPPPCGSSLGLAIAYTLAQGMGGDLLLESEPATGSTFVLVLPRADTPDLPAVSRDGVEPLLEACRADGDLGGGRVLYIDDNPVSTELVKIYLQGQPNIELICCSSGADGLKSAQRLRPDIIIVDSHLPDMSGMDSLRAIQSDPDLARTPCIFLSEDGDEQSIETAIGAGFRECLSKPVDAQVLVATLDRLLSEAPMTSRF